MGWKRLISIWSVLLLGLILRCINLSQRGLWYDDAFSIFLSQQDYSSIISGTAADTMPPLYYFALHLFLLVSSETWWLRLLNVLVSMANIYLAYCIVKHLGDRTAGLVAAFLVAISPIHIYHAQEIRMYTFLVFGLFLYTLFFLLIWRPNNPTQNGKQRWMNWGGMILGGVIAMYSHNLAIFSLIIPHAILLLRREWYNLLRMSVALVGIFTLATPWLLMIPGQVDKIQTAFWTPRPGIVEIIQALVVFTAAIPLPGVWQSIGILVSFEVLVFVCLGLWKKRLKDTWQTGFLLSCALIPPGLMFFISYLMRPVFVPRGFLFSSLGYFGLVGLIFSRKQTRIPGWFILVGSIIAAVISLPYQTFYDEFPRSPYQTTMSQIRSEFMTGDVVIHSTKLSYFPSHYYAPDIEQLFLADDAGSHNDTFALASQEAMQIFPQANIQTAVGDYSRIFFVVYDQEIKEYQDMGESDHPALTWLRKYYNEVELRNIGDLSIYLFEKNE